MRRYLASFDPADWFVLAAALALLVWLEFDKHQPGAAALVEPTPEPALSYPPRPASLDPGVPQVLAPPADCDLAFAGEYLPRSFGAANRLQAAGVSGWPVAELTETQQKAYDEFAKSGLYFGAFAIGDAGGFSWAEGYGTRTAAQAVTLKDCAALGNRACRVIAELLPDTDATIASCDETLNLSQANGYRWIKDQNGPRAFARSTGGIWGAATAETPRLAIEAALSDCRTATQNPPEGVVETCRAAAVWQR